jgi:ferrous iron transport protein A
MQASGLPDESGRYINENDSYLVAHMNLSLLQRGARALVESVDSNHATDVIAQRLRELGFVAGEPVSVLAFGPLGADTIAVQVGFTRFALRRSEAARVRVTLQPA